MNLLLAFALLLQEENPLKPLTEIGRRLNTGIADFLKGSKFEDAFPGWKHAGEEGEPEDFRARLQDADAARATSIGFEFELVLFVEKKEVAYIRTFVYADEKEAVLLQFSAKSEGPKGVPSGEFKGETLKPFADAQAAFAKSFQDGTWEKLPFATQAQIESWTSGKSIRKSLLQGVEEGKKNLAATGPKLAKIPFDEVHIRLDDQTFLVRDSQGNEAGMLRATMRADAGALTYEFSGYPK